MGSEPVPGFATIDRAIRNFVHVEIDERALSMTAPRAIELEQSFVRFLMRCGIQELSAAELYERHAQNVHRQAGLAAEGWQELGQHRPYARLMDEPGTLACWRNPAFEELTGFTPIPGDVASAYDWMRRNAGTAFLLPALCYLRAIGCDRIFLTDGTGDEGIDCIGRMGAGPFRSLAIFVQAKSSMSFVGGDQFSAMHARFAGLPSTRMFRQYLDALQIPQSTEGAGLLFAVAAQGRFKESATQLAWKSGALLRSGRSIAQTLGGYYPHGALDTLTGRFVPPDGPDLNRNLATDLAYSPGEAGAVA